MGIALAGAKFLLKEHQRLPFTGEVVTLGRQGIHFSHKSLTKIARQFQIDLRVSKEPDHHPKHQGAIAGYMSDAAFFRAIGFSDSKALDVSDYEAADYLFDLNSAELPEYLSNRFDVVLDGGTIEHVFHIPNALRNAFRMLRPGGRIIHMSPSSNHIDHGFYMFSPTLFWDYYVANEFEVNTIQVFRYTPRFNTEAWQISNYTPGCLAKVQFGGLDDGMYGVFVVATKTERSTCNRIPQQGMYIAKDEWGSSNEDSDSRRRQLAGYYKTTPLRQRIKETPVLGSVARYLLDTARRFKRKGLGLDVIAKY